MTDGTLASIRTTGSSVRRSHPGANSTMNTETNSEQMNPIPTPPTVVRIGTLASIRTTGSSVRLRGARARLSQAKSIFTAVDSNWSGSARVPGLAPVGMFLQYGSIGSNEPLSKSSAGLTPPAPALQLTPLPGIVPAQVNDTVELNVTSSGSSTLAVGEKSSMTSGLPGCRTTAIVYAEIPPSHWKL